MKRRFEYQPRWPIGFYSKNLRKWVIKPLSGDLHRPSQTSLVITYRACLSVDEVARHRSKAKCRMLYVEVEVEGGGRNELPQAYIAGYV